MRNRFISWMGILGLLAILGQVIGCWPWRYSSDEQEDYYEKHDEHYEKENM